MAYSEQLLHDTTKSYKKVDYRGIEYTVCKDYDHISRYKKLRQVIHYLPNDKRFITLELTNSYDYHDVEVDYFEVPASLENRLDLISYKFYGTSSYGWVLAQVNGIDDGFTVLEGQVLKIPKAISDLFKSGRILSSVPVTSLNLGTE